MKKLFILLVVLCGFCFVGCVTPSTAKANKDRQLVDIRVINDCSWAIQIGLMQKGTTKWKYYDVGKTPVYVTVYLDAEYKLGVEGTYDSYMSYSDVTTDNNTVWRIKWSSYSGCYTISKSE